MHEMSSDYKTVPIWESILIVKFFLLAVYGLPYIVNPHKLFFNHTLLV